MFKHNKIFDRLTKSRAQASVVVLTPPLPVKNIYLGVGSIMIVFFGFTSMIRLANDILYSHMLSPSVDVYPRNHWLKEDRVVRVFAYECLFESIPLYSIPMKFGDHIRAD
jgi:hypothetical protein